MDMTQLYNLVSNATYGAQAVVAFWGICCVVLIWRRIGQKRFRTEEAQNAFLDNLTRSLSNRDFQGAASLCEGDDRAVPQLAMLAILNRQIGFAKVRQLIQDRFERDVMSDLDNRMTWVYTAIKTAPMLGLYGTVLGMMAAFGKLAAAERVNPTQLAEDISFALITTAIGLTTAIPLMVAVAAINIRTRRMEELVAAGLNYFLETFHATFNAAAKRK
jgi:biopolymer transport protein ExbB/TolQ